MGGSASYRYGKKISEARANGATEQEIAELERRRQDAIAREKAMRAGVKAKAENQIKNHTDRDEVRRLFSSQKTPLGEPIPDRSTPEHVERFSQQFDTAQDREPEITSAVQQLADKLGMPLQGFDFRKKGLKSAVRKYNDDLEKDDNPSLNDLVRFTHDVKHETFGDDVNRALQAYKDSGFEIMKVKNYWEKDDNPYNGINVNMRTPNGQVIEVQFHTKDSLDVKENQMHKIYEEMRLFPEGSPEYNKLNEQSWEISRRQEKPVGVNKIKNYP